MRRCIHGCNSGCKNLDNIQFKKSRGLVEHTSDLFCALQEIEHLNEQIKLLRLERISGGTSEVVRKTKLRRPKKGGVREGDSLRSTGSNPEDTSAKEE